MTKEELLKDRYKVIGPYPEMERHNVKVGDILTEGDRFTTTRNQNGDAVFTFEWETFPNIFRKLYWWENRDFDLSGMYIRAGELNSTHSYYKLTEKIESQHGELWRMEGRLGEHVYPLNQPGIYPATEQEFTAFINMKS